MVSEPVQTNVSVAGPSQVGVAGGCREPLPGTQPHVRVCSATCLRSVEKQSMHASLVAFE